MSAQAEEFFCVSIVSCDSYQVAPFRDYDETYSQFTGRQVQLVPVIRVFGVTPSGQKACVHVHGTYPYISVEYEGDPEQAREFSRRFASSLEKVLNKGMKNPRQHVHNIKLFQATPYYGYHKEPRNFLRIQFYNTLSLKRTVELMHSGTILNQSFQPYEAHIPYVLQFFIDYNLFGMNMLRLSQVAFRSAPEHGFLTTSSLSPSDESSLGPQRVWNVQDLHNMYRANVPRQSSCELECDCSAFHILNNMYRNVALNPGLADIWEDERQRHKEEFDMSKITPLSSQDRSQTDTTAGEKLLLLNWKEKLRNLQKVLDHSQAEKNLSQEEIDESDMDFIQAMASMIADEESDSILSTQNSNNTIFKGETYDSDREDEDEKETLEMSQIVYTPLLNEQTTIRMDDLLDEAGPSNASAVGKEDVDVVLVDDSDQSDGCGQLDMTEIFLYDFSDDLQRTGEREKVLNDVLLSSGSDLALSGKRTSTSTPVAEMENILQLDGAHEDLDSDLEEDSRIITSRRSSPRKYTILKSKSSGTKSRPSRKSSSISAPHKPVPNKRTRSGSAKENSLEHTLDVPSNFVEDVPKSPLGKRSSSRIAIQKKPTTSCPVSGGRYSLRGQTAKSNSLLGYCYSENELLEALPARAAEVMFKYKVSVSRNINLQMLQFIGSEKLHLKQHRLSYTLRRRDQKALFVNRNKDVKCKNAKENCDSISDAFDTLQGTKKVSDGRKHQDCDEKYQRETNSSPDIKCNSHEDQFSFSSPSHSVDNHNTGNSKTSAFVSGFFNKIKCSKDVLATEHRTDSGNESTQTSASVSGLPHQLRCSRSVPSVEYENDGEHSLTQIYALSPGESLEGEVDFKCYDDSLDGCESVFDLPVVNNFPYLLGQGHEDRDVLYNLAFSSPINSSNSIQSSPPVCNSPTGNLQTDIVQNSGSSSKSLFQSNASSDADHPAKKITRSVEHQISEHDSNSSSNVKRACSLSERSNILTQAPKTFHSSSENIDAEDSSHSSGCLNLSMTSEDLNDSCIIPDTPTSTNDALYSQHDSHNLASQKEVNYEVVPATIPESSPDSESTCSQPLNNSLEGNPNLFVSTPVTALDSTLDSSSGKSPFQTSKIVSFYDCLNISAESANATLVNEDQSRRVLTFGPAPTRSEVEDSMKLQALNPTNVSLQNKDVQYPFKCSDLEEFRSNVCSVKLARSVARGLNSNRTSASKTTILTPVTVPPSRKSVELWCKKNKAKMAKSNALLKMSPCKKKSRKDNTSTPQHADPASIKGRRLSDLRKMLFEGRAPSPVLQESNRSNCSSASLSLNNSENQNMTLKPFDESFSMIEGYCPAESSQVKVPLAREKFHTSSTNAQPLSLLSMELHVTTRGDLRPDPKQDSILGLFYCLHRFSSQPHLPVREAGAILVSPGNVSDGTSCLFSHLGIPVVGLSSVDSERDLVLKFSILLQRWDPDIVIGYEIERQSWGYLLERWSLLEPALCTVLSRIPELPKTNVPAQQKFGLDSDGPDPDYVAELSLPGRIVLNIWKILRSELALMSYTFENVFYHVLNQRVPKYSYKILTESFKGSRKQQLPVLEYYLQRAVGSVELLEHFNLVGRTSELARIFGIQFYEVFSRGSQFRVESMMLRLVQSRGFLPVSCSVQQRAHARSPEFIQLILEPDSRLYTDPVVVLDFQSLYPSIIIANNYCYSTCLGRLEHLGKSGPFEFGCNLLSIPPESLKEFEDLVTVSPCGVVFVKREVRTGVLPIMLEEILNTRIMVKQSMKKYKDNKALTKLLDARQLGLKLIANVTYGYTGANFSGRMPCVEVADSIISKSRETLQNAIKFVETKWAVSVVYGDTDSMFIWMPGRSREEAFKIGQEIADAVTAMSPKPVKLKFEKVYQPCVLQTKKRYVGFMYETPDQAEPVFDAKGIETVRRDSCPAVGKILEKSLRLLFTNLNISTVESYVKRQFQKIFGGRASMQDLIFAKEYRGKDRYRPGACVPALEIARHRMQIDPRSEPLCGERVPYVIVYGPPGLPLIKLVREPRELLLDPSLKLNAIYYVTRVIAPPLDRVFALMGVNVQKWIQELPRIMTEETLWDGPYAQGSHPGVARASLSQYFARVGCLVCGTSSDGVLCLSCRTKPQLVLVTQRERLSLAQRKSSHLLQICQSCSGLPEGDCISLDCPNTYQTVRARNQVHRAAHNLKQACQLLKLSW